MRLIDNSGGDTESVDVDCPECGSDNVRRSTTYSLDEVDTISPWCESCGHGWMTSTEGL